MIIFHVNEFLYVLIVWLQEGKGEGNGGKWPIINSLLKCITVWSFIFLTLPLTVGGVRKRSTVSRQIFSFLLKLCLHLGKEQNLFCLVSRFKYAV